MGIRCWVVNESGSGIHTRESMRKREIDNAQNGSQTEPKQNGVNKSEAKTKITWFHFIYNQTLMPLLLMAFTPNLVMVMWYAERYHGGSYQKMVQEFISAGPVAFMSKMWGGVTIASPLVSYIILGYSLFQLILMKILPGPVAYGPVTPKGNTPVYTDNGFACYVVTMASFTGLTYYLKTYTIYSPSIVYDLWGDFLITITLFSMIFCVFLTLKGLYYPSSEDHGTTGNLLFDYYWGTELYPRVFGWDIKVFTNCRFGMTVWPLLVCIFAVKSYELHGYVDSMIVSAILQMAYFTKFFWWEAGYMSTIDIMVDRAGYYLCWGCLAYVPGFYASVSLYLVNNPVDLGAPLALAITAIGLLAITVNYFADWQKQIVRSTDGNCLIWGSKPEVIRAKYTPEDGEERESLLLASGWWGFARHFHYVPELTLAFCWTVPALFENLLPYSYFIFLFILLVHRTFRDDTKCARKYNQYWDVYKKRVPYKMIRGIF